jgi:T3SS negative regulator,GrlR
MIRNALYLLSSQALDGVEGGGNGVLVLRDGTIRGGNSFFYYVGSYSCFAEGRWKGEATVQEHSPAPATMPMAGKVNHIGFAGTYTDEGAEIEATALVGKRSLRYHVNLRLLIAD